MWKRLKLVTLVVLTVLLAWLTYPTWQSLLASDDPPVIWTADDMIRIAPLSSGNQVTIDLESYYLSVPSYRTLITPPRPFETQETLIKFWVRGPTPNAPLPYPSAYISVTGNLANWFADCVDALGGNDMRDTLEEVLPDQVPESHRWVLASDGLVDVRYYQLRFGGAYCALSTSLWHSYSGLANFSAPAIEVLAEPGGGPNITGTSCVRVQVNHPAHLVAIYQSPINTSSSDSWQSCGDEASIGVTKLGLSDVNESAKSNRNLFFAGVVAGVLGALAIEIFNGTFDIAESWSARRRTRRDEQEQRPEPTPEPPPEPDDEVDRDQLPLF